MRMLILCLILLKSINLLSFEFSEQKIVKDLDLIKLFEQKNLYLDRKGNGGDVVICEDASGNITSTELLDYYEARVQRGIIVQPQKTGDHIKIALNMLTNIERFSKVRGVQYKNFINQFMANIQPVDGLVNIDDSNHLVLPKGCYVEQLIILQKIEFPEDKLFLVNKRVWDHMDAGQRAGSILHEAFYIESLLGGERNSKNARYFHSKMVSINSHELSDFEYLKISKLANFENRDFKGIFYMENDFLKGAFPKRLIFSNQGKLTAINKRTRNLNIKLDHPLLKFLEEDFSIEKMQEKSNVFLSFKTDNLTIELLGQRVELLDESSLVIYKDGSLEFTLSRGKRGCYETNDKKECGIKLTIDKKGSIISSSRNTLVDAEMKGWSFSGNLDGTYWSINERQVVSFSGNLQIPAVYENRYVKLEFKSLENLKLIRTDGTYRPMAIEDKIELLPTSIAFGNKIASKVYLYQKVSWNDKDKIRKGRRVGVSNSGSSVNFDRPVIYGGLKFTKASYGKRGSHYFVTKGNNTTISDSNKYNENKIFKVKGNTWFTRSYDGKSFLLKNPINVKVECEVRHEKHGHPFKQREKKIFKNIGRIEVKYYRSPSKPSIRFTRANDEFDHSRCHDFSFL